MGLLNGTRGGLVVAVVGVLAGCGADRARDESVTVATRVSPEDAITATVSLTPLPRNGACGVPPLRRADRSLAAVTDAIGIFGRPQRPLDVPATAEVQGLAAGDIDFEATRSPSGLGERLILVPTHTVKETCDADPAHDGPPGVCVIRGGARGIASRCFAMRVVGEGRAAALVDADHVVGVVPDGVERVLVEAAGGRADVAVVENAYLARVPPGATGSTIRITLVRESLAGCMPSAALRTIAPTLDHPRDPGGVPAIVRRSVRPDVDSRTVARYARLWGGGDGITYWIVPRLRCEFAWLEADMVCVTPVKPSYAEAASACVEPGKTGWIHFPDGAVSAIAGFAPAGAREAVVRVEGGTAVLAVRERVFAGRLEEIPLGGEVGRARIEYR